MMLRAWPVKAFVIFTIMLSTVPLIALVGIFSIHFINEERARYHSAALQIAVGTVDSVDRDLLGLIATGQTLATSRSLATKNYEEFYRQAVHVRAISGAEVIYKSASGQQFVNTRLAWGDSLPISLPEGDRRALEFKRPFVSNLFIGATAGRAIISINIPVLENGEAVGLINLAVDPERFQKILVDHKIPNKWITSIVGADDRIVARNVDHANRVGAMASEPLRRQATGSYGMYMGNTLEGTPTLSAYARSRVADWRVALGVPLSVVEEPFLAEMINMGLLVILCLGGSVVLSVGLGTVLARSVCKLADTASEVGAGRPVDNQPSSMVTEVNDVRRALLTASERLQEHEVELLRINKNLEDQVRERTIELAGTNRQLIEEIANRELVEEQLRQAQKMEAIGRLSGGIAHDFNNYLAIIVGCMDMLRRRLARQEYGDLIRFVDGARQGSQRAAALTQRLLAFSRQQPLAPSPVNLNSLITSTTELIEHSIGREIRIETVLAAGIWLTHADPIQLEQSIVNLAVNARDAMPEGGRLTLETANFYIDEKYQRENPSAMTGQYVMVAVTDTGCGMTSDVIGKAFEPFYTSKVTGHGTGLGLSQVYGFVKQSGGHVKNYSEVGEGTTVRIYLPRYTGTDRATLDESKADISPPGNETILVVDDESALRDITTASLQDLGYRVLGSRLITSSRLSLRDRRRRGNCERGDHIGWRSCGSP